MTRQAPNPKPLQVNASALSAPIERVIEGARHAVQDLLAVEEPLEIRITYQGKKGRKQRTISVTMRTPGADRELAAGFLLTEGIVQSRRDILATHPCRQGNRIRVHLRDGVKIDRDKLRRNFYMTSSCGVCGKSSIDSVLVCARHPLSPTSPQISSELIHQLPERLREVQAVFTQTGGLHACALFDPQGMLQAIREDVGRHNALDKLIGQALLADRVPLSDSILLVSGRASFELVQKASVAGIPVLAAVSAPSSLAVDLAADRGMTLLGFVRQQRFNVYCGGERIVDVPMLAAHAKPVAGSGASIQ